MKKKLEQSIVEGNRVIAEFMGVKIVEDKYSYRPGVVEPLKEEHLAYHTSWDWLMPSWEKLRLSVWHHNSESYPKEFMLFVKNFQTACFNNSIGDARNAVIDSIQWHKKNKPNN